MRILLTATDGDEFNPRKGTALINLHVSDDNNHTPVVRVNYLATHVNNTSKLPSRRVWWCGDNNEFEG